MRFGKDTGKLLYNEPAQSVMFVSFHGALTDVDDDGAVDYVPRGDVFVNVAQIAAFYDHTLVVMGRKIRVMETLGEIEQKITRR